MNGRILQTMVSGILLVLLIGPECRALVFMWSLGPLVRAGMLILGGRDSCLRQPPNSLLESQVIKQDLEKSVVLLLGVLTMRALLFEDSFRAPDYWKLPFGALDI